LYGGLDWRSGSGRVHLPSVSPGVVRPGLAADLTRPAVELVAARDRGCRGVGGDRARSWGHGPMPKSGLDWTTQALGQQHISSLCARGEARRREDFFVVVVVAWRVKSPWLLKLMTGFGRAAPKSSRPHPQTVAAGTTGLGYLGSSLARTATHQPQERGHSGNRTATHQPLACWM